MGRKAAVGLAGVLCLGWLAFQGSSAGTAAPDPVLVRLSKSALDRLPEPFAGRVRLLAELEAGWIAAVDRGLPALLKARGASLEILDAQPAGKKYFLIDPSSAGSGPGPEAFGRTVPIDGRTCLFWTDDGREACEVLPAGFSIKSLTLDSGISPRAAAEAAGNAGRIMGRMFRPPLYNSRIAGFVSQVSRAALAANILALQNFVTRYASYPGCEQAGDYLHAYFSALGLRTEFDPFTFSSNRSSRNVVAAIPGTVLPEYVVIVCAHYDSISGATSTTLAPGADDNASGTAAVMEIARILAGRSFDFTIKLICFSAEEWGLYGSKHYAQEARNAGEKILGVLNMDMIAYTDALPEDLNVFTNDTSKWLGSWFVLCARQYAAVDLAVAANPSVRASDHSPFWDQGYSALLAIEDYAVRNPYYHKTTDVLETLNMDFAAAATKIVLAVACGLAQPGLQ